MQASTDPLPQAKVTAARLIAGELLAAAGGTWLIVRPLGRFRSCPYPRPAAGGAL